MMIARQQTAAVQRTGRATASAPGRLPVALPRSVIVRFKEGEEKGGITSTDKLSQLDLTKLGNEKPMAQLQDEVRGQANGQFQDRSPNVSPIETAFTRQREIWAGRAGILGFFAACFWETIIPDHPGVIGQISKFTGLSPSAAAIAIFTIIGWNAFSALRPHSASYSEENRLDSAQRPKGPPASSTTINAPTSFFGISGWGFTKKNELFNGRLAMLGFTAAVFAEIAMGGAGPLAQVAHYLNVTPDAGYYSSVQSGFGVYALVAIGLAYLNGKPGWQADKEADIY